MLHCMTADEFHRHEPTELPIDGVLDLHTFRPRDVKEVVLEYLAECQAKGIFEVRIIHGKGIGELRRSVHALLSRHPEVTSYSLASALYGGTGATIVHLRQKT
jgi:DNA-nicking Smr family endonuclease